LGIDLEAHINDEETAETFRDLHLEKSKQTIKLLFYGTLLLLEIISGYHKRLMKTETLLRTKTMQRAAILLKQVSDPTRLQVVTLLSEGERHVGGLCD